MQVEIAVKAALVLLAVALARSLLGVSISYAFGGLTRHVLM